jgi:hypothetical protein
VSASGSAIITKKPRLVDRSLTRERINVPASMSLWSSTRWRSSLTSLRHREATPRRFKTCSLKVFDDDQDGGKISRSEYMLYDKQITVIVSSFEQITSVLPFYEWGTLYYYELDRPLARELVYEEVYSLNDPNYGEYMKTVLKDYARRISRSPGRMCLQLHKRFL